jgi:hypothetical protein
MTNKILSVYMRADCNSLRIIREEYKLPSNNISIGLGNAFGIKFHYYVHKGAIYRLSRLIYIGVHYIDRLG